MVWRHDRGEEEGEEEEVVQSIEKRGKFGQQALHNRSAVYILYKFMSCYLLYIYIYNITYTYCYIYIYNFFCYLLYVCVCVSAGCHSCVVSFFRQTVTQCMYVYVTVCIC